MTLYRKTSLYRTLCSMGLVSIGPQCNCYIYQNWHKEMLVSRTSWISWISLICQKEVKVPTTLSYKFINFTLNMSHPWICCIFFLALLSFRYYGVWFSMFNWPVLKTDLSWQSLHVQSLCVVGLLLPAQKSEPTGHQELWAWLLYDQYGEPARHTGVQLYITVSGGSVLGGPAPYIYQQSPGL